jgi:hypothetical protein
LNSGWSLSFFRFVLSFYSSILKLPTSTEHEPWVSHLCFDNDKYSGSKRDNSDKKFKIRDFHWKSADSFHAHQFSLPARLKFPTCKSSMHQNMEKWENEKLCKIAEFKNSSNNRKCKFPHNGILYKWTKSFAERKNIEIRKTKFAILAPNP